MYVIPIIALFLVIVIGSVWSPIFALLIAVPLFVLFLAYVGLSKRADQELGPSHGQPASGEGPVSGASDDRGAWGEKRA